MNRSQSRSVCLAVQVVLALSLLVESTQALPFFVDATANAGGGCLNANVCGDLVYHSDFEATGVLLQQPSTSVSVGGSGNGASSAAQGIVGLGALQGFATASASTPNTLASAAAQLRWHDHIIVGSSFIPAPGEAFSYGARLILDIGAIESQVFSGGMSSARVESSIAITGPGVNVVLETGACSEAGALCPTHLQQLVDGELLLLQPFQNYSIDGRLSVGVDAHNFNDPTTSVAGLVDALGTARFHLDPITPGATYTTDSGISYLTPVPEPATLYLLGCALTGMVARNQRTRQRLVQRCMGLRRIHRRA